MLEICNSAAETYFDERLQSGIERVLQLEFQGSNPGYSLTCCKCQQKETSVEEPPVLLSAQVDPSVAPPVVKATLTRNENFICPGCAPGVSGPQLGLQGPMEPISGIPTMAPVPEAIRASGGSAMNTPSGAGRTGILTRRHSAAAAVGPTGAVGAQGQRATRGMAKAPATVQGQAAATSNGGLLRGQGSASLPRGHQQQLRSAGVTPAATTRLGNLAKSGASAMAPKDGNDQQQLHEEQLSEHAAGRTGVVASPAHGKPAGLMELTVFYEVSSDTVYCTKAAGPSLQSARTNILYRRYCDVSLVHAGGQGQRARLYSSNDAASWVDQNSADLSEADKQRVLSLEFGMQDPWRRTLCHTLAAIADWVLSPQSLDAASAAPTAEGGAAGPSSRGAGPSTTPTAVAAGAAAGAPALSQLLLRLQPWAFAIREDPDVRLHGSMVRPSSRCIGGRRLGKPPTSLLELVNAPPLRYSVARERLAADDWPPVWDAEYDRCREGSELGGGEAPPSASKSRARRLSQQQRAVPRGGKAVEEFRAGWALPLQRLAALLKRHHKRTYGSWKVAPKQLPGIMKGLFEGDLVYGGRGGQQPNSSAGGGGAAPTGSGGLEAFLRDLGATKEQVLETLEMEEIDANVGFCAECGFLGDLVACDTCVDSFCLRCIGTKRAEDLPDPWQCKYCQRLFALPSATAATGSVSLAAAAATAGRPAPAAAVSKKAPVKAESQAAAAAAATHAEDGTEAADEAEEEAEEEEEEGVAGKQAGAAEAAAGPVAAPAPAATAAPTESAPSSHAAAAAAAATTSAPMGSGSGNGPSGSGSGMSKRGRKQAQPRNKVEQPWKRSGAPGAALPPKAPSSAGAAAGAAPVVGRPKRAAAVAAAKALSPPAGSGRRRLAAGTKSADQVDATVAATETGEEVEGGAEGRKRALAAGKRSKDDAAGGEAIGQEENGGGAAAGAAKRRRQSEPAPAQNRGQRQRPAVSDDEGGKEAPSPSSPGEKEEEEEERKGKRGPEKAGKKRKHADAAGAGGARAAASAKDKADDSMVVGTAAEDEEEFRSAASGSPRGFSPSDDAEADAEAAAAGGGEGEGGGGERVAAAAPARVPAAAKGASASDSSDEEEEDEEVSGDSDSAGRVRSKRQRDADFKHSQEDEEEDEDEAESENGSSDSDVEGADGSSEEWPRAKPKHPITSPKGLRPTAAAAAPAPRAADAEAPAEAAATAAAVAAAGGGASSDEDTEGEPVSDSDDSELRIVGEVAAPPPPEAPAAPRGRGGRGRGGRRGRPPKAGSERGRGGARRAPRRTRSLLELAGRKDIDAGAGADGRGAVQGESESDDEAEVMDEDDEWDSEDESGPRRAKRQRPTSGGGRGAGRGRGGGGRRGGRPPRVADPGRGGRGGGSRADRDAAAMLMLLNRRNSAERADGAAAAAAAPGTAAAEPVAAADAAAAAPPPAARGAAAAAAPPPPSRSAGLGSGVVLLPTGAGGAMPELIFTRDGAMEEGLRIMNVAVALRLKQSLVNAWTVVMNAAVACYDVQGMPQKVSRVLHGLGQGFGRDDANTDEKQDLLQALICSLQHSVAGASGGSGAGIGPVAGGNGGPDGPAAAVAASAAAAEPRDER